MSAVSTQNRIYPLLVALVYVFFSTFGAVAHTDTSVDRWRHTAVSNASTRNAAPVTRYLVSAKSDCAVCEWQALSVTQTTTTPPPVHVALLSLFHTVQVYSVYTVCLTRFSSRAPPSA